MSLAAKVKQMLFNLIHHKHKCRKDDYVGVDISRAIQRNERASVEARQALEDMLAQADRIKGNH